MRILLTNDDGVSSEGLAALAATLSPRHELCVVAPDRERSGVSHAMSLREPGKLRKLSEGRYACSGTPADCVILVGMGAIPFEPELVVSGINRGANLGTDIIYSGTCGAARQAVLFGLPGIAVSCVSRAELPAYGAAASFVAERLEDLLAAWDQDVFININAPDLDAAGMPAAWARPSRRHYHDKLAAFDAPDGQRYCFLSDSRIETAPLSDGDAAVVASGRVAVSRILVHPQISARDLPGTAFPSGGR